MGKTKTTPPAKLYEPKERERRVVQNVRDRRAGRTAIPALKMDFDDARRTNTISYDHEDQAVAEALAMYHCGTSDIAFFTGLLRQVAALGEPGKEVSEDATNFALAAIRCIEPRDEVETMLATQMAVTHHLSMQTARRLSLATSLEGKDSAERAFNKLARTYTTQMEALKRYRAKAQQVVRVERVTVNEGGRAIVGDVHQGGGGDGEN